MSGATVRTWVLDQGRLADGPEAASFGQIASALPEGAYTTLRTVGRERVLRLESHFLRLEESAGLKGLSRPGDPAGSLDRAGAKRAMRHAIQACGFAESRLRLTFAPPSFFVSIEPFQPLPEELYQHGVACGLVTLHRDNPRAKDTAFIGTASAAYASLPEGVHEGLMLADDGAILEGMSSNFFAVKSGELWTEGERVLLGVTRSLVLEVARTLLPCRPLPVRIEELEQVQEAFVTSVSRGILPVVRIDEARIGDGQPGTVTLALRRLFSELEAREATVL